MKPRWWASQLIQAAGSSASGRTPPQRVRRCSGSRPSGRSPRSAARRSTCGRVLGDVDGRRDADGDGDDQRDGGDQRRVRQQRRDAELVAGLRQERFCVVKKPNPARWSALSDRKIRKTRISAVIQEHHDPGTAQDAPEDPGPLLDGLETTARGASRRRRLCGESGVRTTAMTHFLPVFPAHDPDMPDAALNADPVHAG